MDGDEFKGETVHQDSTKMFINNSSMYDSVLHIASYICNGWLYFFALDIVS